MLYGNVFNIVIGNVSVTFKVCISKDKRFPYRFAMFRCSFLPHVIGMGLLKRIEHEQNVTKTCSCGVFI